LPSHGVTESEVYSLLIKEYNRDPEEECDRSSDKMLAYEKLIDEIALPYAKRQVPTDNPEKSVRGYDPGSPQAFNVSLIYDLVNLPIEKISIGMVKSHPAATKF
jgi:hypothetical protein